MTEEIVKWILVFFIYSFLGYLIEISLCSLAEKKLVNRGFLFGPILPIYGFGMLAVLLSTQAIKDNLSLTFLISTLVCSTLEYSTSFFMEKLFHIKWWDYSKTDKYNLNGRICLRNCLAFGISGSLIVYQVQPLVGSFISLIPGIYQISVASALLVLFLVDTVASTYAVLKAKKMFDFNKIVGDQTNEIKRFARRAIKELFRRKKKFEKNLERKRKKLQKKLEKEKRKLERKLKK
ncbi:putative ABC transporter permease [Candidatus Saccharibacteria bacterium]|nr:putative ABC transporter permease [Candidatus Saccharibacteria bacterium]